MRILIVEDEYSLAEIIGDRLKKEKYDYDILTDGEEGLYNALCGAYNLAILDVMLPNMNGFEILKQIRENKVDIKVIMLTAKTELDDKLSGFRYGADDYITKPFHIEELMARVNVQLRKDENKNITDVIEAFDLKLNLKKALLECTKTSESIEISNKEFMLLEYLMQNKNIIVSKEQIYDKVWGIDNEIESNNLEAYLSFIRKKINILGSETKVKAVRGLGYKLEANDE
ncbi:MAG: response regulator transcription factor [Bacilli bacterium]|nr:response regulator transcription factor [Bacilli bacterium]